MHAYAVMHSYATFHEHTDSKDPAGRRDFVRSGPILVTFTPSTDIQDQHIHIPIINDEFNEAVEGFFVIVLHENISDPEVTVELVRDGITLVNIEDDDRK